MDTRLTEFFYTTDDDNIFDVNVLMAKFPFFGYINHDSPLIDANIGPGASFISSYPQLEFTFRLHEQVIDYIPMNKNMVFDEIIFYDDKYVKTYLLEDKSAEEMFYVNRIISEHAKTLRKQKEQQLIIHDDIEGDATSDTISALSSLINGMKSDLRVPMPSWKGGVDEDGLSKFQNVVNFSSLEEMLGICIGVQQKAFKAEEYVINMQSSKLLLNESYGSTEDVTTDFNDFFELEES